MKKLVILLAVLAFCLPAYAADPNAILVYKVSGKLTGIDITAGEAGKINIRGYLVMDVNYVATDPVITDDVLILYGPDAAGTYAEVNFPGTIDDFVHEPIKKGAAWGIEASWNWNGVVGGKAKARKIGSAVKEVVAKSMKGSIIVNNVLVHYGNDVIGSGKIKLRLSSKLTKIANEGNMSLAVVQAAIEADLPKKPKF